jgi:hypothetical protein
MLSKRGTLIGVLLLSPVFSLQGNVHTNSTPNTSEIKYEIAGPYDEQGLTSDQRSQLHTSIRKFLWDHLRNSRLAKLQITGYTLEGDKTTIVLFV